MNEYLGPILYTTCLGLENDCHNMFYADRTLCEECCKDMEEMVNEMWRNGYRGDD